MHFASKAAFAAFHVWVAMAGIEVINFESDVESKFLDLPEVSLQDLQAGSQEAADAASRSLAELGALVVTGAAVMEDSLRTPAKCILPGGAWHKNALKTARQMAHGRVRRLSLMADFGLGGLSPHITSSSSTLCDGAEGSYNALRASIQNTARILAGALDRHGRAPEIIRKIPDHSKEGKWLSTSLSSALESRLHLEHLHVYQEVQNVSDADTLHDVLQFHTDLGLLLAFVPPLLEGSGPNSPMLLVEDSSGSRRSISRPQSSDCVIFFAGQTARLLASHGEQRVFRPLPHALHLPSGFGWRAWYGVMFLVPEDTIVTSKAEDSHSANFSTFGEIWNTARGLMAKSDVHESGVGSFACGSDLVLADQVQACSAGNISCWMTCMSTAGLEQCTGGYWVPGVQGSKNEFQSLTVQCRNTNDGGAWPHDTGKMCPHCKPACTLVSSASTPTPPKPTGPTTSPSSDFCQTSMDTVGVSMYMIGFQVTSMSPNTQCIVWLWSGWVLDTPLKFTLGCFASIALCACVELFSVAQRGLSHKRQRDLGVLLHICSLTLAYLGMLLVMTYSVEIFACVIFGFLLGHISASLLKRQLPKTRDGDIALADATGSPCCVISRGHQLGASLLQGRVDPAPSINDPSAETHVICGENFHVITLSITGMTCGSCVQTVQRALKSVEGTASVNVSLQDHSARVISTIDHAVATPKLCDAVTLIGFEAVPITAASGATPT